jgi:hypothetical protein
MRLLFLPLIKGLLLLLLGVAAAIDLVTYATDRHHEDLALLRRTASRWNGWSALHVIGTQEGFDTHGLVDKLRALRRFARRRDPNAILVFVDAYDVIINNEPFQLEAAFLASGKRVLIASELGCCADKPTALALGTACHRHWPFLSVASNYNDGRRWLNSGVIIGYARDLRKLLRLAWKEYVSHPAIYRAMTDQQLLCFLMSDGATVWTRESVGIDHMSETALTTYQTDIVLDGVGPLSMDDMGRIVFENRTVPAIIHFNGPKAEKAAQMQYARAYFPLVKA